jgi:nucleoid-associated protein YgaU
MNQLTGSVAQVLGVVTGFVDTVISQGEDITNSLSRAVGLIKYAKNTMIQYRRRVGAISYAVGLSGLPVPRKYRASAFIGNSMSDTLSIQELLNQLLKRFQALSRTVPMNRHRTIIGDSLQKLSTRYYGVPDHWKRIYDHNKLTSTDLTRGAVLEIPKL